MKLVKKTCPNCGYIIQNYTRDNTYGMVNIGIPYTECPECNSILINKNIKEANMLTTFDYIRICFWDILGSLILSLLPLPFVGVIFNSIFSGIKNVEIILIVAYILTLSFCLSRCYKNLKDKLIESEDRLKDEQYKKITEKIKKEYYGLSNIFKIK